MGNKTFQALVLLAAAAGLCVPHVSLTQSAPSQGPAMSAIGPGFADLAERLEPAVVAINAKMTARGAPATASTKAAGGQQPALAL
jgi:S1-C subfamily serine protease